MNAEKPVDVSRALPPEQQPDDRQEDLIDEGLKESFPASDPPATVPDGKTVNEDSVEHEASDEGQDGEEPDSASQASMPRPPVSSPS